MLSRTNTNFNHGFHRFLRQAQDKSHGFFATENPSTWLRAGTESTENNSAGSDIVLLISQKDYEHFICQTVFG